MRCGPLLLACALAALAVPGGAQFRDRSFAKRHLPRDQDGTNAALLGDVDRDGHLDLVLGNNCPVSVRLYLGDGAGLFREAPPGMLPAATASVSSLALGDVDGDGDPDLILGGEMLPCRLYLNDGRGAFADATAGRMPQDAGYTRALALGDVDGDGDLDLIKGNLSWQNRLYLNDGRGAFTDATAGRMPVDQDATWSLALGDVDRDGDLDLICGNRMLQNRLYLNDGKGAFADATAAGMPPSTATSLALGDVDRDGDPDLLCGDQGPTRLLLNDGKGGFTDGTSGRIPAHIDETWALALVDVDGNGGLDLVVGNSGQSRLFLNDGRGVFADATASGMPPAHSGTMALAAGDLDGDGDPDLVCGNHHRQNRLYLNGGRGAFHDATPEALPEVADSTRIVALGDVDGDGDPDLVCGNDDGHDGRQNRLYLNDGNGAFADATAGRLPAIADATRALILGDLDGDGDLDLLCGNAAQPSRLHLNDGKGAFADATAGRIPANLVSPAALAAGDIDGDGDLDLFAGNSGQNRLYLNDGKGSFTDATAGRLPVDTDLTGALALGDLDGDGDLDLVCGNLVGQNRLYRNDGRGSFAEATGALPPASRRITALALGDVDRDGDLDLIGGSWWREFLFLNDGQGRFTEAAASRIPDHGADETTALAPGDVDGDGDLDLVCGHGNQARQNRLYLNDGAGAFTDASAAWLPVDGFPNSSLALGDLDGDGDLDLVCGNVARNRLYLNFLAHLEAPYLPLLGRNYRLDLYEAVGHPRQLAVAFPFLASAGGRRPIPPFGAWRLDCGKMVPLPLILIAAPATEATLQLLLPSQPVLAGAELHAQAVILRWPATAAFSRATADRVVP